MKGSPNLFLKYIGVSLIKDNIRFFAIRNQKIIMERKTAARANQMAIETIVSNVKLKMARIIKINSLLLKLVFIILQPIEE